MNAQNLYVVEWSDTQQQWHIDTLATSMRANMDCFLSGHPIEFSILAVVDGPEEADRVLAALEEGRSKMVERMFNAK